MAQVGASGVVARCQQLIVCVCVHVCVCPIGAGGAVLAEVCVDERHRFRWFCSL